MPVLNLAGQAAMGIAGGTLSIDGATPAALSGITGGEPRWYQQNTLIFQDVGGGNVLKQYNLTTLTVSAFDPSGEDRLAGGNGKFAAFLSPGGVRTNYSGLASLPAAAIGDIDESGNLVINTNFQAGTGLAAYDPTGALKSSVGVTLLYNDPIPFRSGYYAYLTAVGGYVRTLAGVLVPALVRTDGVVSTLVPVVVSGELWLLERTDRLTIRRAMEDEGYEVSYGMTTFTPDAREISPGVARIAWSVTQGETPDQLVVLDLTVATGANTLGVVSGGALVFTPQAALPVIALPATVNTSGSGTSGGSGGSPVGPPTGVDTVRGTTGVDRLRALPRRREYPELDRVPDDFTRRTLKLLWDRTWDFEDRIRQMQVTQGVQETTIASVTANLDAVRRKAEAASIQSGLPTAPIPAPPGVPGPSPGPPPPGPDPGPGPGTPPPGNAPSGCANAGANGHLPAGTSLDATAIGMIVCGVGHEFPALSAAAVDQATRDANQAQLLGRVIWHLQLAGFQAGKQRNPSQAISGDKVTVLVGGGYHAYDIFTGPPFNQPLTVKCDEVVPADYVPDGGIPD